jgi:hypothetical protein
MWMEASPEVKKIYTRKHLDAILRKSKEAATTTRPTLTPVIEVMVEALTSNDPDYVYLVDGSSNRFFDVFNVSFNIELLLIEFFTNRRFLGFGFVLLIFFPTLGLHVPILMRKTMTMLVIK